MSDQKKERFLVTICKLYRMAFRVCPARLMAMVLVLLLFSATSVTTTYFTQRFFDSVVDAVGAGALTNLIIGSLALMITSIVINHVLNGIENYISVSIHIKLIGAFQDMLNRKSKYIDPIRYEDQDFLNHVNKAVNGSGPKGATFTVVAVTLIFANYIPYIIFMGVYLFQLQSVLVISLLLVSIPVLITQLMKVSMYAKLEDLSVQSRRENEYHEKCIIDRRYFKETRTIGAYSFFMNLYKRSLKELLNKSWKTESRAARVEIIMSFITLIGYISVLLLLIQSVLSSRISIGAFAAVFASIDTMFEYLRTMINQQIGGVTNRIGVAKNFTTFLDVEERGGSTVVPDLSQGVSMENVSFSYPGAHEPAVSDVSLQIQSGETVAIVGENGAGKSTLVRLLMGLYCPDSGRVMVGGANTSQTAMDGLFKDTSGVFQKYERYKMNLRDNIQIGDYAGENSADRVEECLSKVGITPSADAFPQGLNTMLSTDFGGIDLSGGQWQRVAIARGIYKDHNLIALDEPTSAIDPLEEKTMYESFGKISKDKTSIIVTHRLGSARIADRIIVMDKGRLIENGSHEALLAAKGKYAQMYEEQASWYV